MDELFPGALRSLPKGKEETKTWMKVLSVCVFLEGCDRNRKKGNGKNCKRVMEKLSHDMKTFASDRALGYKHQNRIRQWMY